MNPEYIGFCIQDKSGKIVHKECIDLSMLSTKLKLSSIDHIQVRQNNKRKYEITIAWKHIFDLCKHYKVSNFVIEELNFKDKLINTDSTIANYKTKNIWHRT